MSDKELRLRCLELATELVKLTPMGSYTVIEIAAQYWSFLLKS